MDPRFVTKTIHAYLDYPVAILLLAAPFGLSLGQSHPLAFWLSVVTGVAALALTILTDHHLGLIRILPYKFHVAVDGLVGLMFLTVPLVIGFAGMDLAYYLINGGAVAAVVALHKPEANEAGNRIQHA